MNKNDFPPGARFQEDGSVTFPMKGKPPVCNVPGYHQDETDAFKWIRDWIPCQHRLLGAAWICASGKKQIRDLCVIKKMPINPKYCDVGCTEPTKGLSCPPTSQEHTLSEAPLTEAQ